MSEGIPVADRPRIALVGGGVHATVVADCIRESGCGDPVGYFDRSSHDPSPMQAMGVPYLGEDSLIPTLTADGSITGLILGIAGLEHVKLRKQLVDFVDGHRRAGRCAVEWFKSLHPRAVIARSAQVDQGAVVFAGAVVNPLAKIGKHAVVNTHAVVEHHCVVGDFAVISPNATLCGLVCVGEGAFVGAGAVVVGGLRIGAGAVVGAGAIVLRDVEDGATVAGNPARTIDPRKAPEAGVMAVTV